MGRKKRRFILGKFVRPVLQFKFALSAFIILVLYSILLLFFIGQVSLHHMDRIESAIKYENKQVAEEKQRILTFFLQAAVLVLAFFASMTWFIINRTHRIYGPMISLNRFVDSLAEYRFSERVILRKNDDFRDVADELNILAEKLEKRFSGNV